ncbi:MAG: hemerythrin domain-containing protein [Methylocystaceae bacterium]|nr:hemerythrin domain-containing protein [Methylocystaceae bacterium]
MPIRKVYWSDKLSTELCTLDKDHQNLIEAFNDFVQAIHDEQSTDRLCDMFQDMIDEILRHFAFEEKMMKNIQFTGYLKHKQHHETLAKDASEVLEELRNSDSPKDTLASANFLRALVLKHMVEQDLEIKEYILQGL